MKPTSSDSSTPTERNVVGSRPLTGSSRISVRGSPSSAAAMPSRWPMPSEKPPTRLPATPWRPVISMTSSTRLRPMPCVAATARRWFVAERPECTAFASSSAPTSVSGERCCAYGRPLTVTVPDVGRSSPMIIRMVVDFPAPFGPRNPVTLPACTVKSMPATAVLLPYLLVSPRASIMVSSLVVSGTARPYGAGVGRRNGRAAEPCGRRARPGGRRGSSSRMTRGPAGSGAGRVVPPGRPRELPGGS